jgi:hypothetical protein
MEKKDKGVTKGPTRDEIEKAYIDISRSSPELSLKTMKTLLSGTNSSEFKFQYSNWIIEQLDMKMENGTITLSPIFHSLPDDDSLNVSKHKRESEFQFERLIESISSITYNGRPLKDVIKIHIH